MKFAIRVDKQISSQEFVALMRSVGWGTEYNEASVLRSIQAYPFIAHARNPDGHLVGYISAFSDGAFSTMLGELVVRPDAQRKGVGRALLSTLENAYRGVPVYAKPLGEAKHFFLACGYRSPVVEMPTLFKKNVG